MSSGCSAGRGRDLTPGSASAYKEILAQILRTSDARQFDVMSVPEQIISDSSPVCSFWCNVSLSNPPERFEPRHPSAFEKA